MPTRTLTAVWGFIDLCLLAAALVSILFSQLWRTDEFRKFMLNDSDMLAGLILGIFLLISFLVSLFAITQRKPLVSGLYALNVTLIANSITIVVIGSYIWFFSLQQKHNYLVVWEASSDIRKQFIQDKFSCCGYNNGTDISVGGSFCRDAAAAVSHIGCIAPITTATDFTLRNVFTSIYGFIAITLSLFLASLCHINQRIEEDRFRRIDEKRGGKGFV